MTDQSLTAAVDRYRRLADELREKGRVDQAEQALRNAANIEAIWQHETSSRAALQVTLKGTAKTSKKKRK